MTDDLDQRPGETLAAASRRAQGLPPTVSPETLQKLRLLIAAALPPIDP